MIKITKGDRYGMLSIQGEAPRYDHKKIMYPRRIVYVKCDCSPDIIFKVRLDHLRQKVTKSCGCIRKKKKV